MITIIDYGAGNLKSVEKALNFLGYKTEVTDNPDKIKNAEKLILPGVGSFKNSMDKLHERGLAEAIKGVSAPLLGICLGLQLLFEYSEEGDCEGLGMLEGRIKKIPDCGLKIPQIGWNSLNIRGGRLFEGVKNKSYVYFVHSYCLDARDKGVVSATVSYGAELEIAVEYKNLFATQFHPEKSGGVGLRILENFAKI
ncbi:MAG: Imidazole glycerol phosphate synthase subunit HisH 1 [Firmicutes bacterium ADurb.Bin193]|nr:MAG: Imidazole glycerol phosphate synthase subunit HisH 1 [Firmicutes bacterium ADurb.Bin193]